MRFHRIVFYIGKVSRFIPDSLNDLLQYATYVKQIHVSFIQLYLSHCSSPSVSFGSILSSRTIMQKDFAHFFYLLGDKKRQLPLLIALFLSNSFLDTLGIGLIGPFIALVNDASIIQRHPILASLYQLSRASSPNQFIVYVGLGIAIIFCLKLCLSYGSFRYIYKFSFNLQADLQKKLLHAYLVVPYTFHLRTNTALLIQNIVQEAHLFCTALLSPVLLAVSNGFLILLLVSLLAITNIIVTMAIASLILLVFIFYSLFRKQIAEWGKEGSEASGEIIRVVNHSLGGLKETHIIGCEEYFEAQLAAQVKRYAASASAYATVSQLPRLILEAVLMLFLIGFVSLTIILNGDAKQLIPTLSVFALTSIRLLPSAAHLIGAFGSIKNNSHNLQKLYLNLKEAEAELSDSPQLDGHHAALPSASIRKLPFQQSINLHHVSYRYPGAKQPALNGISLDIPKGQSIALIGRSGAGKTTLVDVILGLLIPNSGDIRIDGRSIYTDIRAWQNMLGYIPQSIFLTDDTIERNIAFGVPDHEIDQQKLQKAVRSAQLESLIEQLPEGLQTSVGERGVRLSGGQRQRVGIARALYFEREILVLDEATASLDTETEQLVTEAIRSLSGTKTMIIIAHRLSTIQHCDRVYYLEQGQVAKVGSYEEVVVSYQGANLH